MFEKKTIVNNNALKGISITSNSLIYTLALVIKIKQLIYVYMLRHHCHMENIYI